MNFKELEVPIDYIELTEQDRNVILDKIIDAYLTLIETALAFNTEINRVNFLTNTLKESMQINEHYENYEVCALIKDLIDRINDC